MKCLVCGKDHEAAECPRCGFPDIQIMGDQKAELEKLMPTILAYKTKLLGSIRIRLPVYHWTDQNGRIVADRTDWLTMASADRLAQEECWLPEKFARIPDLEELPVTIRICDAEGSRELVIPLPNLREPELQQLGAVIDADCNLRLLLRSDPRNAVSSAPIPLFD